MNKKAIEMAMVAGIVLFMIIAIFMIFSQKPDKEALDETNIDFELEVIVRNTGDAPAMNIPLRLALPFDHPPGQYVENIRMFENPERKTRDSSGNRFVHYNIKRLEPGEVKNFTFNISLRLVSVDFNIQKSNISMAKYNGDMSRYLLEDPYIEINDSAVRNLSHRIAIRSGDTADIAWNTYEWIIENINYQQIPGEAGAAQTLKIGEGGSAEFGNLFVALMRANGIPARRVSGWGKNFKQNEELFQQRFSHGWAEFYLPGSGWIPVDPTFGRNNRFRYFAKTDAAHVIMTTGTDDVHFLERGPYEIQDGRTEIITDYKIKVMNIKTKNLSLKRDMIVAGTFMIPVLFAAFILYKKSRQRHI